MNMLRHALVMAALLCATTSGAIAEVTKYIRYEFQGRTAYGVLDGETVRELSSAPWAQGKPTGKTAKLSAVRLLAPAEPSKVIAAGLNYKSRVGERPTAKYVGLFAKMPTSIVAHEADIVYPADAGTSTSKANWCW